MTPNKEVRTKTRPMGALTSCSTPGSLAWQTVRHSDSFASCKSPQVRFFRLRQISQKRRRPLHIGPSLSEFMPCGHHAKPSLLPPGMAPTPRRPASLIQSNFHPTRLTKHLVTRPVRPLTTIYEWRLFHAKERFDD